MENHTHLTKGSAMKTLQISEETYEKIKGQLAAEEKSDLSSLEDMIGSAFFFMTVTFHFTGRVKKVIGKFVQLEDAAWVADSGRLMQAIKDGTLSEVEPVGDAFVNLDTVTDFFPWRHELPKEQK